MIIQYCLHKLFGWEYWAFNFGHSKIVRRAHQYKDGTKFCIAYSQHHVVGEDVGYPRNWRRVF